ncbi:DUF4145 domain-containing protein [Nocardia sp. BMG51109]|uniref:DUF4145 domain-containing protein n=1 Tax=Nocardia sp. BMG51109 TaxID=1056816 RepID=UPI000462FA4E|nr:DUF4145 domain-containing protein [Nocardia sp. BMG51109]
MAVDQQIRELAERTANFGYLLAYEPVLVVHGAAAEAALFTDPNTAMFKCRLFGETLVERAFISFGLPNMPDTQHKRLKVLSDQGFLDARVHGWFDSVRKIGNQAVHEGYAGQREALLLVRACYECRVRTSSTHGGPTRSG